MKKKIFLIIAMISMLICILAISAQASDYFDFGETEELENIGITIEDVLVDIHEDSHLARVKLSCTCEKGSHTYPTWYIMQKNKSLTHLFSRDYNAINSANPCGATYSKNSIIAIEIPEGIKYFYYESNAGTMSDHALLEYVKIPSTQESLCSYAFARNTNLRFVDFSANAKIKLLNNSAFNGCTALVGVSLPDTITTFQDACFIGCYNLGPVHLPESLTNLGTSNQWNTFQGGEYGNGAKPTKMFFTNEQFTNPLEVEKPTVYYMPSNLSSMDNGIRGATNINDVIVFPSTFTQVSSNYSFCGLGGTEEKSKAIVFLGDMTSIPFAQETTMSYVDFYFLNENDNLSNGENFHGFARQTGSGAMSGCIIHSCADGKALNLVNTFYGTATWTENLFKHLENPAKTTQAEADCENNAQTTTYCFCNALIGIVEKEGTALGHNHDLDNGASLAGITYADFAQTGAYIIKCSRCENEKSDVSAPALFTYQGFSSNNAGEICVGYLINREAIAKYESANEGASLEYGMVAAAIGYIGENVTNPLNSDATPVANNVIKANLSKSDIYAVDFKLIGDFSAYAELELVLEMYVYDGSAVKYVYSNGENSETSCNAEPKIVTYKSVA